MYLKSGTIVANKKDIEAMRVFLQHARQDMAWGGNGTYSKPDSLENETDTKELKKGELGYENILFILQGLCDKWPRN